MNFEPQKLFIGVIDFFSVLMPGAFLIYLTGGWIGPILFGASMPSVQGNERWMVFFFVSYLLGHIIFLLGARLDGLIYDRFRKCTSHGCLERMAEGKPLPRVWERSLARGLFKKDADLSLVQVIRLKSRALKAVQAGDAVNAYQWCKALLSLEHPAGLATVERLEADSKFFRSFVVVLIVLLPYYAFVQHRYALEFVCLVVLLLALWRYADQRFKATLQAYWLVLTLIARKGESAVPAAVVQSGLPTHAGGVVYRMRGGAAEYLLVQASGNHEHWVLPKGHIEASESSRFAAVREVHEETGHWARQVGMLGDHHLSGRADAPLVRYYLMELVDEGDSSPEEREMTWLALAQARQQATFEDSRQVLDAADVRRIARSCAASTPATAT